MIITQKQGTLEYLTAEGISVPHCFTTRYGGVSTGILDSLNLGMSRGDDPVNVVENYRRLGAAIGFLLGLLYAALLLRFGAKGITTWLILWFGGLTMMQVLPWKTHEVTNVLFPVLGIAAVVAVIWSLWVMGRHCLTK